MTADARVGSEIAAYRIVKPVGRGGMGVVYLAEDTRLGRPVALKLLSPQLAEDTAFRARFVRESRLAATIEHPNIIPIYGAGEEGGVLYLAMRYVDGTDVRAAIDREGALAPPRAVAIAAQVASALDAAHARGLVHRDVKPANVLLLPVPEGEHAYLSDFGLTREAASAGALTRTGQLVGTVDNLAPELIEGRAAGPASDQYSLACMLYEGLSGRSPFRRSTEAATLWAHMQDPAPPLEPELEPVQRALGRGLAKRPEDRYATCTDLVRAVRAGLPEAAPERGRPSGRVLAIGALAVVGAIALAVVLTARLAGSEATARPAPPADSLLAIAPSDGAPVGAPIRIGSPPSGVVVSDRWVWVTSAAARSVTLVDARTRTVRRRVRLGATPTDAAAGAGGSVWIAEGLARKVVHIDPDPDRVPDVVRLPGCCPGPSSIAAAEGVVWVGDAAGTWRIDLPEGHARRVTPPWPAAAAAAVDGDGNAWLADGWDGVVSINRSADFIHVRLSVPGEPADVAVVQGSPWVLLSHAGAVVKLADTGVAGRPTPVGGEPVAAVSAFGALWVATARAGTITRIDPISRRRRTFRVGGRLSALAAGDGLLWTAVAPRSAVAAAAGTVAYTVDPGRVVVRPADGSGSERPLAGPRVANGMVAWSPDGRQMAYIDTGYTGQITTRTSCAVQTCSSLWRMDADGRRRRRMTHPPFLPGDFAPRWSPDGRVIAVWRKTRTTTAQPDELLLVRADGGRPRTILRAEGASLVTPGLDWSPDGRRLVVERVRSGHPVLEVIDRDGGGRRPLTLSDASGPRWSPDGTRIAYFGALDGPGIYVTGVDGRVTHRIVATPVPAGSLGWSPDGRQLVFSYASDATRLPALLRSPDDWSAIYLVNADGSGRVRLAAELAAYPDWRPRL